MTLRTYWIRRAVESHRDSATTEHDGLAHWHIMEIDMSGMHVVISDGGSKACVFDDGRQVRKWYPPPFKVTCATCLDRWREYMMEHQ